MPGLLTLRPGLGSASKTTKSAGAKNAVSTARAEKGNDDRSQVQAKLPPPAFVRPSGSRGHALSNRFVPAAGAAVPAAQVARPKQVTDPLGEAVKPKVCGNGLDISQRVGSNYSSSGSEHEINSVCLAEMVHDFMEEESVGKCGRARCNCESGTCGDSSLGSENDDSKSNLGGELSEVLQGLIPCVNPSETAILDAVSTRVDALKEVDSGDGKSAMRWVMGGLRSSGYNAAICKSRWEHAGGFPGGDYEYIDVVCATSERIIVDIDFKTQFEIARPTLMYGSLLQLLPPVFVGKADRLQQIVNIMCDAAKRSLKKRGMPLPPWRKPEYIKAKWFASYRRTTNEAYVSSSNSAQDIGRIALRGAEWDSKYTSEMETSYHRAADRKVLRENNGDLSRSAVKATPKKQEEQETEGVVRGANRMLAGLRNEKNTLSKNYDIVEAGTGWEPPIVVPRPPQKPNRVAGLASILKEAGLTAPKAGLTAQLRKEMQEQPHGNSMGVASGRGIAMAV